MPMISVFCEIRARISEKVGLESDDPLFPQQMRTPEPISQLFPVS